MTETTTATDLIVHYVKSKAMSALTADLIREQQATALIVREFDAPSPVTAFVGGRFAFHAEDEAMARWRLGWEFVGRTVPT